MLLASCLLQAWLLVRLPSFLAPCLEPGPSPCSKVPGLAPSLMVWKLQSASQYHLQAPRVSGDLLSIVSEELQLPPYWPMFTSSFLRSLAGNKFKSFRAYSVLVDFDLPVVVSVHGTSDPWSGCMADDPHPVSFPEAGGSWVCKGVNSCPGCPYTLAVPPFCWKNLAAPCLVGFSS